MKNKTLPLLFAFLLIVPSLFAEGTKNEFFAKVVAQNDSDVYMGDSTIVSVYLFGSAPIGDVQILNSKVQVAGQTVRRLYLGNNLPQSRVRQDGKIYYRVLAAQYSVQGQRRGKVVFPALQLVANLYFQQESGRHRDPFFDPFGDFFSQPTYKKEKVSTRSTSLPLEVKDAPRKSIKELGKMGKNVI